MVCECIERPGLGKDISKFVICADMLDQDGCRKQFRAEPVMVDGQRFGSWCHARRISGCECQGRSVVFEQGRDGVNPISENDGIREVEDGIEFED